MKKYTVIDDPLYDYLVAHRSGANDPFLDALRAETMTLGDRSGMAISLEQSSFTTFLVASIGAKHAVEIGTFTGSSALAIARGLPADGKLTCFDSSDEWTSIARRHWKLAGVSEKIDLHIGDAARTLPQFLPAAPLDFVFIDADKTGYDFYYETILPHVRPNGIIAFDNMLHGGHVLLPSADQSPDTRAINALNKKLAADSRIQSVLVPISDGIHFCRKL